VGVHVALLSFVFDAAADAPAARPPFGTFADAA
jgi:hypothetical protein